MSAEAQFGRPGDENFVEVNIKLLCNAFSKFVVVILSPSKDRWCSMKRMAATEVQQRAVVCYRCEGCKKVIHILKIMYEGFFD